MWKCGRLGNVWGTIVVGVTVLLVATEVVWPLTLFVPPAFVCLFPYFIGVILLRESRVSHAKTTLGDTESHEVLQPSAACPSSKESGRPRPESFLAAKSAWVLARLGPLSLRSTDMKNAVIGSILLLSGQVAFAGDTRLFEVHSVADSPSSTTKEYSMRERNGASEKVLLDLAVLLDDTALKSAKVIRDEQGNPGIQIDLTDGGGKQFGEITSKYLFKRLGIVIAGRLWIAPIVREPIWGGSVQITNTITQQEATDLAAKLNSKNSK